MATLRHVAPFAAAAVSTAVLFATLRAFLNHEMGSLALMVAAQTSLLSLIFVPPVLAEVRDRKFLSVYREMYLAH